MTEQKRTGRPAITHGPTSQHVADNVRRVRERRGLTIYELAELLKTNGRPIAASAIAKMERRERQVNTDDLTALAAALDVSPVALLLPLEDDWRKQVDVTGAGVLRAADAWDWMTGRRPLRETDTAALEYALFGLPAGRRAARQHPLGHAAQNLLATVEYLVQSAGAVVEGGDDHFPDYVDHVRHDLARLTAELDRVERERQEMEALVKDVPRGE
ncbi:helix-turn-helix domain-containing protein [Streptomyces griseoluteus]|uniref:helix-turn-helix domain-containing protein n=1 Tax=Streptomyces griseoluteus TaxID=29306 RepID=UPI00332067E7